LSNTRQYSAAADLHWSSSKLINADAAGRISLSGQRCAHSTTKKLIGRSEKFGKWLRLPSLRRRTDEEKIRAQHGRYFLLVQKI
jgi:hypothetical protein